MIRILVIPMHQQVHLSILNPKPTQFFKFKHNFTELFEKYIPFSLINIEKRILINSIKQYQFYEQV